MKQNAFALLDFSLKTTFVQAAKEAVSPVPKLTTANNVTLRTTGPKTELSVFVSRDTSLNKKKSARVVQFQCLDA